MKTGHFASSSDGFTLIEMMVVVSIIGLLSSVALPQYARMVAKSRQSEARTALASMYTAENLFQATYSSYTTCLRQAGFEVEGERRYYFVGFQRPASVPMAGLYWDCGPSGTNYCEAYQFNPDTICTCPAAMVNPNGTDCQFVATTGAGSPAVDFSNKDAVMPDVYLAHKNTFKVVAAGSISSIPGLYDVWSIDETKQIINESSGL